MISDFLFLDDDLCLSCKVEQREKYFLCESCFDKLDYVDNEFEILEKKTRVIYFYNSYMAHLIADYKFNRNTSLHKVFGSIVYSYMKEKNMFDFDYLILSPSYKDVIKKRGFDHIKLISDYFIEKTSMEYLSSFKKIKNTKAQHKLSREERSRNLKNAFYFEGDLTGKKILIFDDIITSSNTAKEIIKTIEKANPKEIEFLALASSHKVKK